MKYLVNMLFALTCLIMYSIFYLFEIIIPKIFYAYLLANKIDFIYDDFFVDFTYIKIFFMLAFIISFFINFFYLKEIKNKDTL